MKRRGRYRRISRQNGGSPVRGRISIVVVFIFAVDAFTVCQTVIVVGCYRFIVLFVVVVVDDDEVVAVANAVAVAGVDCTSRSNGTVTFGRQGSTFGSSVTRRRCVPRRRIHASTAVHDALNEQREREREREDRCMLPSTLEE